MKILLNAAPMVFYVEKIKLKKFGDINKMLDLHFIFINTSRIF